MVDGQYVSFPPNRMAYQQLGSSDYHAVYDKLFADYTAKQWGGQTPEWAIKRIPFRDTFNNVYFTGEYQGIPVKGYTAMVQAMLADIQVEHRKFTLHETLRDGELIIYTGAIDELFGFRYGKLGYRSLHFEERELSGDFQGCAVVNHPAIGVLYTRTIEHKHFFYQECENTIVSYEYPHVRYKGSERVQEVLFTAIIP